jgi:hypothetical protein
MGKHIGPAALLRESQQIEDRAKYCYSKLLADMVWSGYHDLSAPHRSDGQGLIFLDKGGELAIAFRWFGRTISLQVVG